MPETSSEASIRLDSDENLARLDPDEFLRRVMSSQRGLSEEEAQNRQFTYGRNEVVERKRLSTAAKFLRLVANPLVIILLIAGLISGLTGGAINALIIFSIVLMSVFLLLYQESKAENAAQKLRERVAISTTVIRDGVKKEVTPLEIVPGDVVLLSAGDIVPGDARVIDSKDLSIDQSALTGESFPVEKSTVLPEKTIETVTALPNFVFAGTSVVTGYGSVVVTKTGKLTEFGKIAHQILGRETNTEFERGLRRFGFLIMQVTILLVLFVFLVNSLFHRGILESLLFSVALAVGLTPELLPMIISVNLSNGALSMAKKGVIVKRLESIQNLGSMDVLCSDKTGTLTENKIELVRHVDPNWNESEKILLYAYVNSHFQTGLKSPMDDAILSASGSQRVEEYSKIDEIPFDFTRRRISVIVKGANEILLITKGAPEEILRICTSYQVDSTVLELDSSSIKRIRKRHDEESSKGFRILGICYRKFQEAEREKYYVHDETGMVFLGFLGFIDPPKKDAKKSIELLRKSNVELKILTGDNELVSRNVCEQLGFKISQAVLGSEIDALHDDALSRVAEQANLFARVTPIQKNRILNVLRRNGHVVGFLGDGINDAPSLKAADVGVSVDNAVDVAKGTADIILLKKSLGVLRDGILEGRKTFGNSMKYVMMGISSNFGNMFSMAGASLILPFLPMLPTQILLNNLLYDFSEATIPTDNVDEEYLERPKKLDVSYIRIFMVLFGLISSVFDFLTFFLMLYVFRANEPLFQTAWFIESFATEASVIFLIRTRTIPFYRSRPSRFLTMSTLALIGVAILIPLTPLGALFGFVVPPPAFFAIIAGYVIIYLTLVEIAKRWFYGRYKHRLERYPIGKKPWIQVRQ